MQEFLGMSSIHQLVLNEFDMLLNLCLKQDQGLLMNNNEDVVEIVLSQTISTEFMHKLQDAYTKFKDRDT